MAEVETAEITGSVQQLSLEIQGGPEDPDVKVIVIMVSILLSLFFL